MSESFQCQIEWAMELACLPLSLLLLLCANTFFSSAMLWTLLFVNYVNEYVPLLFLHFPPISTFLSSFIHLTSPVLSL